MFGFHRSAAAAADAAAPAAAAPAATAPAADAAAPAPAPAPAPTAAAAASAAADAATYGKADAVIVPDAAQPAFVVVDDAAAAQDLLGRKHLFQSLARRIYWRRSIPKLLYSAEFNFKTADPGISFYNQFVMTAYLKNLRVMKRVSEI